SNDGRLVLESTVFFKHEKYNPLFVANDVALVKLPEKVEFSERVQPVRLPTGNNDYAGEAVVVSGWGLTQQGGQVAQELQYATLEVITNSECQKTFSPLVVRKTTLCARGDEKKSPCNGDSGGPLVLAEDKTLSNDGRLVLESTVFFKHEKYNPLFVANDVALVKLPEKVEFSERVQPVRLPTGKNDYAGEAVVVSGWGLTQTGGQVSQELQYATLQVITNSECQKTFSPLVVRKTTLCARGNEKESPCNGDSGGPLVLAEDKTLVGVVSFGHALGCERGFPAAFARVTAFRDWVNKHTGL
uniref:Peptidase S1 domain-containing protein n=1 Tax=Anopheles minimus TaxID=112268 RepID=A0A182WCA2_9DIPT